jgi:drug/metabolite transporter (DMT)-like permease
VIAQGLRDLPPFSAGAFRFLVAAAVMLVLAPRLARREGGERPGPKLVLAQGVLNFALSYGIVYWVETRLASGLVSVLWATFPIATALCSHLFLADGKLRPRQWLGFLAAFAGVVLLFITDVQRAGPQAVVAGLILLVSPLGSAIGTAYVKGKGKSHSSALLNRDGMLLGAVLLSAMAFAFESPFEIVWSTRAAASVLYLAIFGTVLTFGLYFWLMRYLPAHQLSLVAYINPALALVLGAVAGGEHVGVSTLGGLALILVGVSGALNVPFGRLLKSGPRD